MRPELHGYFEKSDDDGNLTLSQMDFLTKPLNSHHLSGLVKSEVYLLWVILIVGFICNLFVIILVVAEEW